MWKGGRKERRADKPGRNLRNAQELYEGNFESYCGTKNKNFSDREWEWEQVIF